MCEILEGELLGETGEVKESGEGCGKERVSVEAWPQPPHRKLWSLNGTISYPTWSETTAFLLPYHEVIG